MGYLAPIRSSGKPRSRSINTQHTKALAANTKALKEVTAALRDLTKVTDRDNKRARLRKRLVDGGPYTEEQLGRMKYQDLIMYAAAIGIKRTTVRRDVLVAEVLGRQDK